VTLAIIFKISETDDIFKVGTLSGFGWVIAVRMFMRHLCKKCTQIVHKVLLKVYSNLLFRVDLKTDLGIRLPIFEF